MSLFLVSSIPKVIKVGVVNFSMFASLVYFKVVVGDGITRPSRYSGCDEANGNETWNYFFCHDFCLAYLYWCWRRNENYFLSLNKSMKSFMKGADSRISSWIPSENPNPGKSSAITWNPSRPRRCRVPNQSLNSSQGHIRLVKNSPIDLSSIRYLLMILCVYREAVQLFFRSRWYLP